MQSTSANYLLMSSLDAARYNLAKHGPENIEKILELASYAREEIAYIPGVDVMDEAVVKKSKGAFSFDPTKLVIKMDKLGLTGFEIYERLRTEHKIQVELGEFKVILAVITPADSKSSIDRLIRALKTISQKTSEATSEEVKSMHANLYVDREMVYTIRRSFFMPVEEID